MKKEIQHMTTYQLTSTALMTAMLCILGPLSIPIGPVPISFVTFLLHIMVFVLGVRFSVVSVILYLLLGMIGLPVFSGGIGGIGRLAGPTGGFLFGYILLVLVQGLWQHMQNKRSGKEKRIFAVIGMVSGLFSAYFVGTIWFMYQQKVAVFAALSICVFPFLLGDIVKIGVAAIVGSKLKARLKYLNMR